MTPDPRGVVPLQMPEEEAMSFGKRSDGTGGLGTTANASRCAVVGCSEPGRPQVCPYDGRRHGHGAVHYDCGSPPSALTFHEDDWYWVCDTHYAVLVEERRAFEAERRGRTRTMDDQWLAPQPPDPEEDWS